MGVNVVLNSSNQTAYNTDLSPTYDVNGDQSVDSSDLDYLIITVMNCSYGDANLDGVADSQDLNIIALHWGMTGASWADGDFNGDGVIDQRDLDIYNAN